MWSADRRPDILVVDAEDHETVAAVRRRIAAGQDVADSFAIVSDTPPDSLIEELELSAPAHDLVQTLVHEPVSALWVMRRPRPSPTAMVAAAALIARARSVRFASWIDPVDADPQLTPAFSDGRATVVRPTMDGRFLEQVVEATGGEIKPVPPVGFPDLPSVMCGGRRVAACTYAHGRPEPAIVLAEQIRLSSGIPLIVLAGPAADRQGLRDAGLHVVEVPQVNHDSRNGLARLWASALAPLDRVVFVTDTVVVHSDLRPLLDGDEFRAVSTDHKQGAVPNPSGELFVVSPRVELIAYLGRRFGGIELEKRGLTTELGQLFPDWQAFPASIARLDTDPHDALVTRLRGLKPWNLPRARRNRPGEQLWHEVAASIGVDGEQNARRLLSSARRLYDDGDRMGAAAVLATASARGRRVVARAVMTEVRSRVGKRLTP